VDACPSLWPSTWVGDVIADWPEDTLACSGSAGMVACVDGTPGAIGYMESGHGHGAGLEEIDLQNRAGTWLNSETAAQQGGIAAAEGDNIPTSLDADFSKVSLLNGEGETTWPIVLISYIYVRKDLSFLEHSDEQSLLVTFLKALYDPAYTDTCLEDFAFTRPSEAVVAQALEAIDSLIVNASAHTWTVETKTMPIAGMDDYVLSPSRRNIRDIQIDSNGDLMSEMLTRLIELENIVRQSDQELVTLRQQTAASEQQMRAMESSDFTEKDAQHITAALVLACLSFVMSLLLTLYMCFRHVTKS
jgi:hypothetical protein